MSEFYNLAECLTVTVSDLGSANILIYDALGSSERFMMDILMKSLDNA